MEPHNVHGLVLTRRNFAEFACKDNLKHEELES